MSEQRTPEWFAERLGKITASRIADVVGKTKSGSYGARPFPWPACAAVWTTSAAI